MTELRRVSILGEVDDNNSYDSAVSGVLGIGGVFTGTASNILDFGTVFVTIATDVASAADGLSIQQSSDGTNWDHTDDYTIPANGNKNYSLNPHSEWFRVVYTNGGTGQAFLRLQSIMKGNSKPSSHRIKDSIIGDDDCTLVKAALTGENGTGQWHNVKTTADGNLTISDNSDGLAIAEGNVTGKTFIHKFGNAPDFDTGDNVVTVWDGANDGLLGGSPPMVYTYSSSADIGLITSSDAGDGQTIEMQGLDSNFDLVTQTITLNGQTDVDISATGVDLIRLFRLKNTGATDIAGVVYVRTNGSAQDGSGVPSVANTIRGIINNGNNQTLMAIFTIPNGKIGYMRDWYASTAGASRSSEYTMILKARPTGEVFQVKHVSAINDAATSTYKHDYVEPEVFAAKTDIEMTAQMLVAAGTAASISAGFDIVLVDD